MKTFYHFLTVAIVSLFLIPSTVHAQCEPFNSVIRIADSLLAHGVLVDPNYEIAIKPDSNSCINVLLKSEFDTNGISYDGLIFKYSLNHDICDNSVSIVANWEDECMEPYATPHISLFLKYAYRIVLPSGYPISIDIFCDIIFFVDANKSIRKYEISYMYG